MSCISTSVAAEMASLWMAERAGPCISRWPISAHPCRASASSEAATAAATGDDTNEHGAFVLASLDYITPGVYDTRWTPCRVDSGPTWSIAARMQLCAPIAPNCRRPCHYLPTASSYYYSALLHSSTTVVGSRSVPRLPGLVDLREGSANRLIV